MPCIHLYCMLCIYACMLTQELESEEHTHDLQNIDSNCYACSICGLKLWEEKISGDY
jgi:hypothetical protein